MEGKKIRSWLELIYQKHNAAKLGDIPHLLEKYKGAEEELLESVMQKYGVDEDDLVDLLLASQNESSPNKADTPVDLGNVELHSDNNKKVSTEAPLEKEPQKQTDKKVTLSTIHEEAPSIDSSTEIPINKKESRTKPKGGEKQKKKIPIAIIVVIAVVLVGGGLYFGGVFHSSEAITASSNNSVEGGLYFVGVFDSSEAITASSNSINNSNEPEMESEIAELIAQYYNAVIVEDYEAQTAILADRLKHFVLMENVSNVDAVNASKRYGDGLTNNFTEILTPIFVEQADDGWNTYYAILVAVRIPEASYDEQFRMAIASMKVHVNSDLRIDDYEQDVLSQASVSPEDFREKLNELRSEHIPLLPPDEATPISLDASEFGNPLEGLEEIIANATMDPLAAWQRWTEILGNRRKAEYLNDEPLFQGVDRDALGIVSAKISVSSQMDGGGGYTYGIGNLVDGNFRNWWSPETGDSQASAVLTFNGDQAISGVYIHNGAHWPNNPQYGNLYYANSRVTEILVTGDEGLIGTFYLDSNTDNIQRIQFDELVRTRNLAIIIVSSEKGDKWDDICISFLAAYQ